MDLPSVRVAETRKRARVAARTTLQFMVRQKKVLFLAVVLEGRALEMFMLQLCTPSSLYTVLPLTCPEVLCLGCVRGISPSEQDPITA